MARPKRTNLVKIKNEAKSPYVEHNLELNEASDGTVRLELYELGESFPEAFISLSRANCERLMNALQKYLGKEASNA